MLVSASLFSKNDVKFTIIEKVSSQDPLYGREREKLHIKNLIHSLQELTKSHDNGFTIS